MNPALLDLLLALAALAIGLSLVIGHALTARVLAILGTILSGVVVVLDLVNYHS